MPESEHSQENLASVRTHMERIEQLVRFQILANKQNADAIVERLTGRAGMAEVYLAVGGDSPRTQDELAAALGKSQPTVSRILKELYDAGLVIKVPSLGNRQVMAYAWSDLEPLLGVSKIARRIVSGALSASVNSAGRTAASGRQSAQNPRPAPRARVVPVRIDSKLSADDADALGESGDDGSTGTP